MNGKGIHPDILAVIDEVLKNHFAVTREDILGRSRQRRVTKARAEAALALHGKGMSLIDIAMIFERDHSTIVYIVNSAKASRV